MEYTIEKLDMYDDALWALIQIMARNAGIKNLTNDEFNNEMLQDIRGAILAQFELIRVDREVATNVDN